MCDYVNTWVHEERISVVIKNTNGTHLSVRQEIHIHKHELHTKDFDDIFCISTRESFSVLGKRKSPIIGRLMWIVNEDRHVFI